jgi:hypothetical protein
LERHDDSDDGTRGLLNVCHGNIDLLSDDDARWMAKVQQLYMKVQQ